MAHLASLPRLSPSLRAQTHPPRTAEGRLVGSVGAVPPVVAHRCHGNAHPVGGTQPLVGGASEGRRGAVLLVAHVQAVVVTVAEPSRPDADLVVGALDVAGPAGERRAGVVFVGAILAVGVAVALPRARDAGAVRLALEFVIVAQPRHARG